MADHATVEYATAPGNDYPAHENTYEHFVHFTFVGLIGVLNLMFGLATGGVMGHWLSALPIFLIAIIFYMYADEPQRRAALMVRLHRIPGFGGASASRSSASE